MTDYAQLSQSLKDNEAFQRALDNQRNGALEALAITLATDADAIRVHQAVIRVVDAIRGDLEQFIRAGQPPKPVGLA